MRRILIVDDDKPIVDSLTRCVDWRSIGVDEVQGVYGAREARGALDSEAYDLLICDIEMPQESGLELVEWASSHWPDMDSLVLTCHADFLYAQSAVRLGCYDYLLKPVHEEQLLAVLSRLFDERDRESQRRDQQSRGELWLRHRAELAEGFWLDLAEGRISGGARDLMEAARERGIELGLRSPLRPIVVALRGWSRDFTDRDRRLLEFSVKKCLEECLSRSGIEAHSAFLDAELALLVAVEGEGTIVQEALSTAIAYCREHFYCSPSCYLGRSCDISSLGAKARELRTLAASRFAQAGEIFLAGGPRLAGAGPEGSQFPDVILWSMILASGDVEAVRAEALSCIARMGKAGPEALYAFRQDLTQAVYSVLRSNRIPVHELFEGPSLIVLEGRASDSPADLAAWAERLLSEASRLLDDLGRTGGPFERATRYIARHLSEDLSCASIAGHVSLNQDYLTRLFKKRTGVPVSEYVARERFRIARELLAKTNLPIGEIASRAGYANLSHFSDAFKRVEGSSPSAFRAGKRRSPDR